MAYGSSQARGRLKKNLYENYENELFKKLTRTMYIKVLKPQPEMIKKATTLIKKPNTVD